MTCERRSRRNFSVSEGSRGGFLRPTRSVVTEARPSVGEEMKSICEMKNYHEKVAEVFSSLLFAVIALKEKSFAKRDVKSHKSFPLCGKMFTARLEGFSLPLQMHLS
jgi:hypothetical protein